jgi:hypothetical protein
LHQLRLAFGILRAETLSDTPIIDLDDCARYLSVAKNELGASTPRKELRIFLYRVNQRKHARCGMSDKHRTIHYSHSNIAQATRGVEVRTTLADTILS